jgi:hypothetical protein
MGGIADETHQWSPRSSPFVIDRRPRLTLMLGLDTRLVKQKRYADKQRALFIYCAEEIN